MLASEKMNRRALFYDRLVYIDAELKIAFGERSNRASATARDLLTERAKVCRALTEVGYQPWPLEGVDIEEKALA